MTQLAPGKTILEVEDLMRLLPHRYPMLLVDRLIDIKPGESAVGVKNVTFGDHFFRGHFPGKPLMPGVLIIEAMAQAAAAFTSYTEEVDMDGKIILFLGVDKARFRKPVSPGDQLLMHVRTIQRRPPVWRFEGDARVDGERVADAQYTAMLSQDI